jgi:hypothetical protein
MVWAIFHTMKILTEVLAIGGLWCLGAHHLNYWPGYCQGSLHVSSQIERRMILILSLQMIACMIMCRRLACEEPVMMFLGIGIR